MNDDRGYDVRTISLLGGDLALDFVNTIEDRTSDHPDDTLRDPADLVGFGRRHALLGGRVGRPSSEELSDTLRLRKALLDLLAARLAGQRLPRAALETLRYEVERAWADADLVAASGVVPSWSANRPETVRHRVAVAAVDLLGSSIATRIRRCDNHDCGWYFLDTSKNGSRRWCSMKGCGTLAKTQRRRRRS